jgi:hypothetical protein
MHARIGSCNLDNAPKLIGAGGREITESIRDLGRRIDHVFHPDRD